MHDVAIVGFGPTGAVAASVLGRQGINTLVVDRATSIYDKPRAIALDHEIMRVFQELGITDEIAAHVAPYPASEYHGVDGRIIKRLDAAPPPLPQGWPPNLSFTQPPVEAALRAHAQSLPGVSVRLGCELTALEQGADHVTLGLASESGRETCKARYVIACDGATSAVRRLAGMELEDLGFDEPWLVVDVKVSDEALQRLPEVNVQYCEPQRPSTYVVGPGNHRRWEIMLQESEDPASFLDERNVWQLLSRWVSPGEATLWRSATYRFHALVARRWRSGRVFLAGDAAHQQPPFLGQGMCQGVRDAANLGWKLARVLRGRAGDGLLDTYEIERSAHVRQLTATIRTLGRFVCERDPQKAAARDAELIAQMGGSVKTAMRQDLMPALQHGFLSATPHAASGTLFPQPRIAGDSGPQLLDDRIGTGFRLVLAELPDAAVLRAARAALGATAVLIQRAPAADAEPSADVLRLVELDGVASDWFAQKQCVAALVRPDNYVFGVAETSAGLARLVAEAQEQLASERMVPVA